MTRRFLSLTSMAATLLLPALSGCAFLHKDQPAPVPLIAAAPTLVASAAGTAVLGAKPGRSRAAGSACAAVPGAQPTPPPASIIADTTKRCAPTIAEDARVKSN